MSYSERGHLNFNPVAKKLFSLMDQKQTNLCFAADVTSQSKLLELADEVGPHICVLKTHVDILEDFTPSFAQKIQEIAEKHNFLIFEDRKFADIGVTVQKQYQKGIYKIVEWADIINAHSLVGNFCIEALKEIGLPKDRALLLIANLSAKETLITTSYTKKTVELAERNQDFVIGFIAQNKVSANDAFLHLTPGVQFQKKGDLLGQKYRTPHEVIVEEGNDIIIVGRGILEAENPSSMAQEYKAAAWEAYIKFKIQNSKFKT